MQKPTRIIRFALILALILLGAAGCSSSEQPPTTPEPETGTEQVAPTADTTPEAEPQATATPGTGTDGVIAGPRDATPNPTPQGLAPITGDENSTIDGTEVPAPEFDPPPTLDELIEQFPDLAPYIEQVSGQAVGDLDFAELYNQIVRIYEAEGIAGVATFLDESGILETLGIPLGYLELLPIYEQGGAEALRTAARERGILNDRDEFVGYLAIDAPENLPALTTTLQNLGVSVYNFLPNTEEVEIGIPLDIIAQYQTPGTLLGYLTQIANAEHVVGFRLPVPSETGDLSLEAALSMAQTGVGVATRIGADRWHEDGITGSGVRIAVMDLGFGGYRDLLGSDLPANVETNIDPDELDAQDETHGTACAVVIHRVAPDAELVLVYFDGSSASSFAEALEFIRNADVDIVSASFGSMMGPRDGTWGDTLTVTDLIRETGILWINAAGNSATSHSLFQFNSGEDDFHDFGNGTYLMPIAAEAPFVSIVMNWNGNWDGREDNNYHLYIYDRNGDEVAVGAETIRGRRNDLPAQFARWRSEPGETYYLAVQHVRGEPIHQIDIMARGVRIVDWGRVTGYSVGVPADGAAVFTVGATSRTADVLESYSSQGPTMDGRIKPDISAPTNEIVPGYEFGFNGTSGATPVVAGAAALVKQAFPDMSTNEIMAYLEENIVDLGDAGEDNLFGTGRLALPVEDRRLTPPDSDEPGVLITAVSVQYNVKLDGESGIQVTLSFVVENYEGRELTAVVLFLTPDMENVPPADDDFDFNGTIGIVQNFDVNGARVRYSDLVLFIPYDAFEDQPVGTELAYIIGIVDYSGSDPVVLAEIPVNYVTIAPK